MTPPERRTGGGGGGGKNESGVCHWDELGWARVNDDAGVATGTGLCAGPGAGGGEVGAEIGAEGKEGAGDDAWYAG